MFADLDETLRSLLVTQVPLDLADVDISFDAPDREWSGRLSRPVVNLFLYDVQENLDRRESGWETRTRENGKVERRRPTLFFDVSYQITAWARAPEDEHRLLSRVLSTLVRHTTIPAEHAQGVLKDQPVPMRTSIARPDMKSRLNPADLWQALENRIRPALTFAVTLAVDPDVVFTSPVLATAPDVRLGRYEGPPQINGRVRDRQKSGQGIAGATILLREPGLQATTDEDGRFAFPGLPPGLVTLVAQVPGRPEVSRAVEVPSSSYDVEV